MGYEYEVEAYVNIDDRGYRYMQVYAGPSRRLARKAAREVRSFGVGAIRTTWRPS